MTHTVPYVKVLYLCVLHPDGGTCVAVFSCEWLTRLPYELTRLLYELCVLHPDGGMCVVVFSCEWCGTEDR